MTGRRLIDSDDLQAVSRILDLVHHRNQNQHRRSSWFKWLSILKRCIRKLDQEIEEGAETRARARIAYMIDHLLPKSYISFTQLVQDNQFSALGLLMLAHLSQIHHIIGIPCQMDPNEAPLPYVDHGPVGTNPSLSVSSQYVTEDLGIAMARSPITQTTERTDIASASPTRLGPSTKQEPISASALSRPHSTLKRAKNPKEKSTIDDLFKGLV